MQKLPVRTQAPSQVFEFYEPGSSNSGPNSQLSPQIEGVARELDGLCMPIGEAVERIKAVTSLTVEVQWRYSYISVRHSESRVSRVIRFRSCT